ncbi:long-chain acyl-CoA synthetase [Ectothiorhodosinus mongolicus]|uniref:Long-chain acyl-CoA synthetase n=1 Tax=Ectothiorhodosinus mongolicus TaxID=233100 RepID=A0A1R3VZ48_9GAMM|nr:AMP-dependent synthetase/ligase [Ectothiorhodosinus mongolicus]ULX57077.1 long-chain fatty acid--CoA ligase [Ectothiorhodosinus mongolicus]SIT69799.1 long-chain acyl-CoA synthetase [Ectothiorhodosinus mongolicus]
MTAHAQVIPPHTCQTLAGLFHLRVQQSPDSQAYLQFDSEKQEWCSYPWSEVAGQVARWQAALKREGFVPGDRVAVMLRNCMEWVIFDQACLGLGLVTVPLYTDDRPDNIAYIVADCGARLLLIGGPAQWRRLAGVAEQMPSLKRIVSLNTFDEVQPQNDERLTDFDHWAVDAEAEVQSDVSKPEDLATIVYTSGTTGRPKGVMLSHDNILQNAFAAQQCAPMGSDDLFLSFLPLSHTLERTAGCYMPMMVGARVAFARSIQGLAEDLLYLRPTILISVPRIYERIYGRIKAGLKEKSAFARFLFQSTVRVGWRRFEYQQKRASWHPQLLLWPLLERLVATKVKQRLGGRLRIAVCGGAPLPPAIAEFFIGLGLPVYHGFGMTEASPVVSVNRPEDNLPASVGTVLSGVEVRIGENDELLVRGPTVMQGYWNNEEATAAAIDAEGWLHSGDQARIDDQGHIFIIGRIKEILVLANGEKVPPNDMEMAIAMDPLFDQALVLGEGKAYLSALLVLNLEEWRSLASSLDISPNDAAELHQSAVEKALRKRVAAQLGAFPGYAQIRRLRATLEPWDVENGMLTPTMKLKRSVILDHHKNLVEELYESD